MAGWEDILNKNEVLFKNSPVREKQEARRRQEGEEEEWDLSFNLFLSSPVMPPDKLFFSARKWKGWEEARSYVFTATASPAAKGVRSAGGEAAIIRFRNSKALSSPSLSFSPSRNHRTRRGEKRRGWGRLLVESANEGVHTFLPLSPLLFLFCCLPPSPVVAPPNGTQLFSFRWLRPDRGKEIFLLSIFIERPEKSAERECCISFFFAEACCFTGNWRMSDQALRPNIG